MKSISDVMDSYWGKSQLLKTAKAQIVMRRWPEVVGPLLAAQTTPVKYRNGTLFVTCKGSAWANELRLRTEEIIDRLNTMAEDDLFKSLRVSQ